MLINTEEIKDEVARHFNTETKEMKESDTLSEKLKRMGCNHLQNHKADIILKIQVFESMIQELKDEGIIA